MYTPTSVALEDLLIYLAFSNCTISLSCFLTRFGSSKSSNMNSRNSCCESSNTKSSMPSPLSLAPRPRPPGVSKCHILGTKERSQDRVLPPRRWQFLVGGRGARSRQPHHPGPAQPLRDGHHRRPHPGRRGHPHGQARSAPGALLGGRPPGPRRHLLTKYVEYPDAPVTGLEQQLARQLGGDSRLLAGIITVQVVISVITLPVIMALLII